MLIIDSQKEYTKNFKKNIGEYHDLYVQNDTLLLAGVFENLGNMCFKMYKFDPANFSSAPRLAQEACLRIHRKEIRIINRY